MNFFSSACLKIAIVNIIGGLLFGYQIGFVAVYDTYNAINTNCTGLQSEVACSSVKFADCTWGNYDSNVSKCYFGDIKHNGFDCRAFNGDDGACGDHSACQYDHEHGVCEHTVGFTSVETGIFAGAMIIGGMIGSFGAPPLLRRFGRKKAIIIVGAAATLSSVLMHISRAVDVYAVLIIARILIGAACGMACVACPMYVDEMAPETLRNQIGVLFQVFCTFGIVSCAAVGLAMAPTNFKEDLRMEMRFQLLIGISTFCCATVIPVGLAIQESTKWMQSNAEGEDLELQGSPMEDDEPKSSWGGNVGPLLVAVALSIAQQMTGINAIMNYAPKITAAAGLSPLLGNFIVMFWNFVTTLISIPVAKRCSMRQMYVAGALVASLACFCTGIPVYPGVVESDTTRHILTGLGIIVFIAAFEIGMGPAFYVLAQELFPRPFRGKGSAFTIIVQFVFNIIINVCFPIAVVGLSGGKAGNQNKGMGIVFMFFGSAGLLSWLVLVKKLHPAEAKKNSKVSTFAE